MATISNRFVARAITALILVAVLQVRALASDIPTDTAVLRALDKVTTRVQTLRVPVGQPVTFMPS